MDADLSVTVGTASLLTEDLAGFEGAGSIVGALSFMVRDNLAGSDCVDAWDAYSFGCQLTLYKVDKLEIGR